MFARSVLLVVALVVSGSLQAEDAASEASVRELIAVTQSENMLETVMAQMDGWMEASMKQAMDGQALTPEQQEIAAEMRSKMVALFKEDMSWASLESSMIEIYVKSFSQSEIDGMVAFYKSELGQAVLRKMPVVMQESMTLVQARMAVMMPKIQALSRETVERMHAARSESKQ